MQKYMLAAALIGMAYADVRGAETPLPKKFHGDWAFSPTDCHSKIVENDTGVRIDASSVLAFEDACHLVKIEEDKGYAVKALFECVQAKQSTQRTITLKLADEDSLLHLGDRQLFRCDAAPAGAAKSK
jgi:hypothetical protein